MKSILCFLACLALGVQSQEADVILYSPQVTNWGTWYDFEYCPEGTYISGFGLKTEQWGGSWFYDDTALNGIKVFCAPIGYRYNNVSITSGTNPRGDFGRDMHCEGAATGFQLRSEGYQGGASDDTSANNFRLICNQKRENAIEGDGLWFGDWTMPQECFNKQAMCGIQTQIQEDGTGGGDETGLCNVNFKCCDVPDPASICGPSDEWDLLIECDNTQATTPTTCTYARKIGVSHSRTESETHYDVTAVYHDLGFTLDLAPTPLSFNFGYNYGSSEITGYNWTVTNTEVWSVETVTQVEFEVPAGITSELFQTLGTCGIYNARATTIKRVDTDAATLKQTVSYFEVSNLS